MTLVSGHKRLHKNQASIASFIASTFWASSLIDNKINKLETSLVQALFTPDSNLNPTLKSFTILFAVFFIVNELENNLY